ncbi:peroxiredoxin [Pacificitalea manganoxidans]|uniref:Peroxiredoxin n=1 Tax=Pacificitalea manganoxidans TaxID=1411902 RepID=A0A291M0N7_9RHOB|nr:OsmC family protein [Pacificitalea manganoxidans]MAQ46643.1 peroxiredoxin [Actibacterium sp.]OWU71810.1 hypothetical protein ATO2_00090 [Roseovarius sp. 22II1-1F6A]ATI42519.1 peroxiredoxin [Pacificitalea manganoxidans]MBF54054.1 peroxiredoxin [Actibacterium sp.]MDR6307619.1 osmotically inducible protein OsmC [Pacificitalea manganoxidans]|tara:strand:+ start:299 stop:721 length:423 start_codon:yes stop_codon:yes gene_type:complete
MPTKKGSAKWMGGLKDGKGRITLESGAMSDQPYGFNTRFEDGAGTNPEELIGGAHAACFSMALSNMLGQEGITADSIETTSAVTIDMQGDGPKITKAHLTTVISADADEAKILEIAEKAKEGCPVSKVLNCDITMDAKVA